MTDPGGLVDASRPLSRDLHLFDSVLGPHLLVVQGSRVYGLGAEASGRLRRELARQADDMAQALGELGLPAQNYIDDEAISSPPLRAISLAVAQKCNLACSYCYASQGDFGMAPQSMALDVACSAIDRLLDESRAGERVNVAFMGGEPLLNRAVLRQATEHAERAARARGVKVGFSVTTNGTLFVADDADFFERHGFAVTVSLDGIGAVHNALRPYRSGRGSFDDVMKRITPALTLQRSMQVSARVTVTPHNLGLMQTLDALLGMGFHSVGFSPMLAAPSGRDELRPTELGRMLEQMVACGEKARERIIAGERYAFANLVNALEEIHRGTHRPYPCGAGAGYLGVSAQGELAACHRFVGEPRAAMGTVAAGVDAELQRRWLHERHVHRQEPCNGCWARYLCGGGCHHEVLQRGRGACDFIRAWLHFCLQSYVMVLESHPEYLGVARS